MGRNPLHNFQPAKEGSVRRILFVDDEPNVLEGLRRMLRPMRHEWDMEFTGGGQQALDLLAQRPFDVVVSDMRMPGMDGAELLSRTQKQFPRTVRIVLSGHSDREMILRSLGATHQYLAKPCDAEILKNTVTRACALRDLLADETLKSLIARMETLPSLPSLYIQVVQELESEDASIHKIGEIISKDVGMTAKILQLVNSAFFGLRRHISSPAQAVSMLGIETVKALVLSVQVFARFDQSKVTGFSIESLLRHSTTCGLCSRMIAAQEVSDKKIVDDALMAGMLHDAGKVVLAANVPESLSQAYVIAGKKKIARHEAEYEVLGTTHAEVGAYLLGLWGLPDPIVEALAFHHSPSRCLSQVFGPLTAVHVANVLEYEETPPPDGIIAPSFDDQYLRELALVDRIPVWRKSRQEACQKGKLE